MADENLKPTPPAPPEPPVVDVDAGQDYGRESVPMLRPFKFKGMTYRSLSFRVPNGFDVEKHISGRSGAYDALALMADLCEVPVDVFHAMYAGDRTRVDQKVGKHIQGVPLT